MCYFAMLLSVENFREMETGPWKWSQKGTQTRILTRARNKDMGTDTDNYKVMDKDKDI
jgi:hypothetical protein